MRKIIIGGLIALVLALRTGCQPDREPEILPEIEIEELEKPEVCASEVHLGITASPYRFGFDSHYAPIIHCKDSQSRELACFREQCSKTVNICYICYAIK